MACNRQPRKTYRPREALNPPRAPARRLRRVLRALAREPRRWGLVLAVVMLFAGTALTRQGPAPLPELEQLSAAEAPDAGAELDAGGVVDVHQGNEGNLRAQRIPERPDPRWARAPCPAGYVEISGTCWFPGASKAPCPVATYEHAGRCYVPLLKAPKVPTSVEQ